MKSTSGDSPHIVIRAASERGHADHGWLNSYHTFSFGDYHDSKHMGYSSLRVINEDRIQGGTGFGAHPHNDMEILSYVINGGLEHKDSMGNTSIILPDEVQIMSAGSGVKHAEMNHFKDRETHFFQIWILPEQVGISPCYDQKSFKDDFAKQNLTLVASKDKRCGSLGIHQDADIYIGRIKSRETVNFKVRRGRHIWIQMVRGDADINTLAVTAGDGLAITHEKAIRVSTHQFAEFILFDLQ